MDAIKHSNDFKPIDSKGDEVESSHLQLDSIPSNSQSKEVVESIHLHLDSSSSKAQLLVGEILLNGDVQVVDNHASNLGQCSYDPQEACVENTQVVNTHASNLGRCNYYPQVAYVENAQVVDNHTSNSGQCSYDPQVAYIENAQVVDNYTSNSRQYSYDPQVAYASLSSFASNSPFTYKGITYYTYEAFQRDFHRQIIREMQMDGVAPRDDDIDEPQFSDCMVFATGGSPAIINPYNGLPWRKGAKLCRPYIDEGCCRFGTACIFHHPWPPTED